MINLIKNSLLAILAIGGMFIILYFPVLIIAGFIVHWAIELYKSKQGIEGTNTSRPHRTKRRYNNKPLTSNPFMSAIEKQTYMQSPEWKALKLATLQRDNNQCVTCNSKANLQLHHIAYKKLGEELPNHVCILCNSCHEELHKELGYDRLTNYPPKRNLIC